MMLIRNAAADSEYRRQLLTSLLSVSVNENQTRSVNPGGAMSTTSGWLGAARVKEAAETSNNS